MPPGTDGPPRIWFSRSSCSSSAWLCRSPSRSAWCGRMIEPIYWRTCSAAPRCCSPWACSWPDSLDSSFPRSGSWGCSSASLSCISPRRAPTSFFGLAGGGGWQAGCWRHTGRCSSGSRCLASGPVICRWREIFPPSSTAFSSVVTCGRTPGIPRGCSPLCRRCRRPCWAPSRGVASVGSIGRREDGRVVRGRSRGRRARFGLGSALPINKNLWTSSYVLFTAGVALQGLALCYWTIDVRGWSRWAGPLVVYGMNALAVFVASGLAAKSMGLIRVPRGESWTSLTAWLYETLFASWAGPLNGSLAFAVSYVLLWWCLMWLLHGRGIHIEI